MRRVLLPLLFALLALPAGAATNPVESEMKTVEEIRHIHFLRPVTVKTITREEFRPLLEKEVATSLPVSQQDYVAVLRSLFLVDASQKNLDPLLSLYQAQVLAFYDPRAHLFYAFDKPEPGLEALQKPVDIHELTHAAQDQLFGAGDRMETLQHDSDAQIAMQALLEGEASLVMLDYMLRESGASIDDVAKNDDMAEALATAASSNPGIPKETPAYYVETLKFPYIEGLRFVLEAYRRGGWKELDAVEKDPPSSSEQILHPELYFNGSPEGKPVLMRPAHSDFATREWPLVITMGEFNWKYLLGEKAAAGWGGDSVELHRDANGTVTVVVQSLWDTTRDASEFADAYRAFLSGKGVDPKIVVDGKRVLVAYGPDKKTIAKFGDGAKR